MLTGSKVQHFSKTMRNTSDHQHTATAEIQMVDLRGQYQRIKSEIDQAILDVVASTQYINGPAVAAFGEALEKYLGIRHVIPCANGTDALQIALMALGLQPGDEVIVPAFTYVATAEVIALLGLKPVMVDVDADTFNVTATIVEAAITPRTKAIVPVHLFGQSCDMEPLLAVAQEHGLYVVEDNAQAIGAEYTFSEGKKMKTSTMGHIGTTSFFPSKNLGCFGDGGAIMTNDDGLAEKMRMIANHGQIKKYYHQVTGVNSRLDTIQAAILKIKLKYLNDYAAARRNAADFYDAAFENKKELQTPVRKNNSTHVFHQYTLRVKNGEREKLQKHLAERGIPSAIYYPVPLYRQQAFAKFAEAGFSLPVTENLCREVLSLPIHTEMSEELMNYIAEGVLSFAA